MHQLEFSERAQRALTCQLGALASGCHKDFTTFVVPRSGDADLHRSEVAQAIYERCGLATTFTLLRELEDQKRLKWGSSSTTPGYRHDSVKLGDSLRDQILRYFRPRPPVIVRNRTAWRDAREYVSRLYDHRRNGKLKPVGLVEAAARQFPRGCKGLGFPFMSSSKEFLYPCYEISNEILDTGCDAGWVPFLPDVLGSRCVPRAPHKYSKIRGIWQRARAAANIAKMWQCIIQWQLRFAEPFRAWIGREAVALSMSRLLNAGHKELYSLDYEQFDASVPFEVIDLCYDILRNWFEDEARPLITFSQLMFERSGIIAPDEFLDGEARTGGVPSGAVETNLIDSIANLFVTHYAVFSAGGRIPSIYVQGDDVAAAIEGCNISDVIGVLSDDLGMTVSRDKSMISGRGVHFLQELHSLDWVVDGLCVGVRPLMHCGVKLTGHERIDGRIPWKRLDDTVRCVSQITDCDRHPRAHEFWDWYWDTDPQLREVLVRIRDNDDAWLDQVLRNVAAKDDNPFRTYSVGTFKSSAAVRYLMSRL